LLRASSQTNAANSSTPAVVGGDDAVDDPGQAERDGDRAGQVQGAQRGAAAAGPGDQRNGRQDEDQADGHVDEQHPAPADPLREHAADDRAHRAAGRHRGAPGAQSLGALARVGERGHDQRHGRRGEDRAGQALDRAGRDEQAAGVGHASGQARGGEADQAGEEHGLGAEQVGRASAEQEQAGEAEGVGVDDPLHAGRRQVERTAHGRQGDVHDADVQDHHELSDARDDQQRGLVADA
jgi:hypothetical protein